MDAKSEIHFAMSGVPTPVQPNMLWHLVNTAPAWRSPRCSKAGAWSITCPCDSKVCLLVCLPSLLPNWTKFTINSYEIRTNFLRISRDCLCVNTKAYVKFTRNSYEFLINFVKFFRFTVALFHLCSPFLHWCLAHFSLYVGPVPRVVAGHSAHSRRGFTPRPRVLAPEQESEAARATGGGRAPSEAGSERSEASRRSGRTPGGHGETSSGAGHAVREVVVPMPSREDLGTNHLDPSLNRVTLAPRQHPAWKQRVAPRPDGRQLHLCAVWDLALEARGVQGTLCISFPCPIVVMGGSNLPQGQELMGMFSYRLVSGHWQVQTGVARTGEEGTVTTAGVLGLNVITGWQQRQEEWVDVAWLAMRV